MTYYAHQEQCVSHDAVHLPTLGSLGHPYSAELAVREEVLENTAAK